MEGLCHLFEEREVRGHAAEQIASNILSWIIDVLFFFISVVAEVVVGFFPASFPCVGFLFVYFALPNLFLNINSNLLG